MAVHARPADIQDENECPTCGHARTTVVETGPLTVDCAQFRVWVGDDEVALSPIERKIAILLALHAGEVLSYRRILTAVWNPMWADDIHVLRVNMARLRQKLGRAARVIQTHETIGYGFLSLPPGEVVPPELPLVVKPARPERVAKMPHVRIARKLDDALMEDLRSVGELGVETSRYRNEDCPWVYMGRLARLRARGAVIRTDRRKLDGEWSSWIVLVKDIPEDRR